MDLEVGAILRGPAGAHLFSCVRRPHVGPQGADCPTATKAKRAMKSKLIWSLRSALCGALLLNGCSSGGGNGGGATTTAGATATGTGGTTGQAATGTSTGGGAGTTTN